MQLFNQLIVILIAATTGANALGCINGGGEEPPVPMNEYWQKAVAAMKKMVEDGTKDGTNAIVGDAPPWRDEEACMLNPPNMESECSECTNKSQASTATYVLLFMKLSHATTSE